MSRSSWLDGIAGEVLEASTEGYDRARRVWNGMNDKHPGVIIRASTVDDVVATVRRAAETGTSLAVRGGGHSLPGFSTVDDGIVLDLGGIRRVEVDPDRRVALVGGGALWGDVDAATAKHGLATTGGLISTTGVGGLTLGGGIGWLTRYCGLACDNLLAATIVTADGSVRRADDDADPELLWALRGHRVRIPAAPGRERRSRPAAVPVVRGHRGGRGLPGLGPRIVRRVHDHARRADRT